MRTARRHRCLIRLRVAAPVAALLVTFANDGAVSAAARSPADPGIAPVESLFADLVDAGGIVATLESGALDSYDGKTQAWWQQHYREQRSAFQARLAGLPARGLSPENARAVDIMRSSLDSRFPVDPAAAAYNPSPPTGHCQDAQRLDIGTHELRDDLYACFASTGNRLQFEGKTLSRDSAIAQLAQIDEPERRKALFLAFQPLWEAVNGHDQPDSPYRRRIRTAAAEAATRGSAIDEAGRSLGLRPAEVEQWLLRILETWREVIPQTPVEPWDYRYLAGAADRALSSSITTDRLVPLVKQYYRDLGADLDGFKVLFDLAPRPGKAPVTYANYVTMGRQAGPSWRPSTSRISANFSDGGLYVLNMLVHESAHAVHFTAIQTRPAFMDIGDALFCEAFADVTSWNVYSPVFQARYLGRSVSEEAGLRSLYTMVTLESAWALFELRMLRQPEADPNTVWTDITSQYFHIIPHPEYSWWAQRVQLVSHPGYLANYGLGAALTADLRQRIRRDSGSFEGGSDGWYAEVSQRLLHSGLQFETPEVVRRFLGRAASVMPLLQDMRRLRPATVQPAGASANPG